MNDPGGAHAGLGAEELRALDAEGMLGPFDLLEEDRAEELGRRIARDCARVPGLLGFPARSRLRRAADQLLAPFHGVPAAAVGFGSRFPWFKSAHAYLPEVQKLARSPAIVDRVASILGPEVILWGAQLIQRVPGQVHRWHCDIEHLEWEGVTIWLGLNNVSIESSLLFIRGSHKFSSSPNQHVLEDGLDPANDDAVLQFARKQSAASGIESTATRSGQFLLFSGKLWHGSRNRLDRDRQAIILQYSRPQSRVRIPCSYRLPPEWHPLGPPCMVVRGSNRGGVNQLVEPIPRGKNSQKLAGQVALITGAGRGIGRAMAASLADAGAAVALVSRTPAELASAAAEIHAASEGAKVITCTADVTDLAAVEKVIAQVLEQLGKIDLLINNAGTFSCLGPLWEIDPAAWRRDLDTTLLGAFNGARAVLPAMLANRRGRIVNLTGGGSNQAIKYGSAYSIAKTGILRFSEGLDDETAASGVRVFTLDPGLVRTQLTSSLAASEPGKKWRPQLAEWLVNSGDVSPDRAARLIVELASGRFDALGGRLLNAGEELAALERDAARAVKLDLKSLRIQSSPMSGRTRAAVRNKLRNLKYRLKRLLGRE